MSVYDLPMLNAGLNLTATIILLFARSAIKRREIEKHKKLMIAGFSVSVAFLISYVIYHANVMSVPFVEPQWFKPIYLVILITHVILAATVPFLTVISLRRGLKREDAKHRKIVRYAYPIWMYVSITGVVIYLLLYQIFPQPV